MLVLPRFAVTLRLTNRLGTDRHLRLIEFQLAGEAFPNGEWLRPRPARQVAN